MLLFALNLVTLLMQIQLVDTLKFYTPVVICFKFSNFAYANTVRPFLSCSHLLLLFALNLVTLLMQIQYAIADAYINEVVICFKFSNFAYANTVTCRKTF